MDTIQYNILKYIDKHNRPQQKFNFYAIEKIFTKKYKLTHKDINEIISNLKENKYVYYVGMDFSPVTTHKGHMFVKHHTLKNIMNFIKTYIYPIIITAIGCFITYYLSH